MSREHLEEQYKIKLRILEQLRVFVNAEDDLVKLARIEQEINSYIGGKHNG
jgi:hypothetical protein